MTPTRGRARSPKPTSAARDAHAEIHIMNVGELQAGSAREWQVGRASCEAAVVGVGTMIVQGVGGDASDPAPAPASRSDPTRRSARDCLAEPHCGVVAA